jgi:hypothetical protein
MTGNRESVTDDNNDTPASVSLPLPLDGLLAIADEAGFFRWIKIVGCFFSTMVLPRPGNATRVCCADKDADGDGDEDGDARNWFTIDIMVSSTGGISSSSFAGVLGVMVNVTVELGFGPEPGR